MALAYVVIYALSCATKHSPNYNVLMVGRLLGGTATSILFSVFESWVVAEHRRVLQNRAVCSWSKLSSHSGARRREGCFGGTFVGDGRLASLSTGSDVIAGSGASTTASSEMSSPRRSSTATVWWQSCLASPPPSWWRQWTSERWHRLTWPPWCFSRGGASLRYREWRHGRLFWRGLRVYNPGWCTGPVTHQLHGTAAPPPTPELAPDAGGRRTTATA